MTPIIDPFAPPAKADEQAKAEAPKTIMCTIDPKNDKGAGCPFCGWATGSKHGVPR